MDTGAITTRRIGCALATCSEVAGDLTRNDEFKDAMTMVQWLPMLLVMPFTGNAITVGKEVEQNLYNNLVVKMKSDGLLK